MGTRYRAAEVMGGQWRVSKTFGNQGYADKRLFPDETQARGHAANLERRDAHKDAVAQARTRAKHHCECKGECGHLHLDSLPCYWGEGDEMGGGIGKVVLVAVALDGNDNNLALANIRMLCQLCRQQYDANRNNGGTALFEIGEPE